MLTSASFGQKVVYPLAKKWYAFWSKSGVVFGHKTGLAAGQKAVYLLDEKRPGPWTESGPTCCQNAGPGRSAGHHFSARAPSDVSFATGFRDMFIARRFPGPRSCAVLVAPAPHSWAEMSQLSGLTSDHFLVRRPITFWPRVGPLFG